MELGTVVGTGRTVAPLDERVRRCSTKEVTQDQDRDKQHSKL